MNQYIYECLVRPYLKKNDKQILQRKDSYFITYNYSHKKKKKFIIYILTSGLSLY